MQTVSRKVAGAIWKQIEVKHRLQTADCKVNISAKTNLQSYGKFLANIWSMLGLVYSLLSRI